MRLVQLAHPRTRAWSAQRSVVGVMPILDVQGEQERRGFQSDSIVGFGYSSSKGASLASLPAIVTDGLWRKSLSAIRCLGKAGRRVLVHGDSWATPGFWSFYTGGRILAPTASSDAELFGSKILERARTLGGCVLLPMEDPTLLWASIHRDELRAAGARVLLPTHDSLLVAMDKSRTLAVASELGIPVPRSEAPSTWGEFEKALESFPVESDWVIKPRKANGSHGVLYLGDEEKQRLRAEPGRDPLGLRAHWEKYGALLLQERIPASGKALGASLLYDEQGRCVAAFAHQRLRQYPLSGGPSTDRMSVERPDILEAAQRLLEKLHWRGIAMVEFKEDPLRHVPTLLEINPRFWGSLELAHRAGVPFAELYAKAAEGQVLPEARVSAYAAGVRTRWMIPGECLRYLFTPREMREPLREFLRGLPGLAEEWDWRDIPGLVATVLGLAILALRPRYWTYLKRG